METKYNSIQIKKTIDKLFVAGFGTDKEILSMQLEDVTKIPNLTVNDILITIEFRGAIKEKEIIAFLSGSKVKGKEKK